MASSPPPARRTLSLRPKSTSPAPAPAAGRKAPSSTRPPRPGNTAATSPRARNSSNASPPERQTPATGRQRAMAPAPLQAGADGIRLNKYLADAQWCSRREADVWIEKGWVLINDQPAQVGQRVQPGDRVDISPAAHASQAQRATILLHKPVGYVSSQAEDGHTAATVLLTDANHWRQDPLAHQHAPRTTKGFAPAGRLDIDSTGLLILTQDGRMARHVIGEHSEIDKEYLVRVSYRDTSGTTVATNVQAIFPDRQLQLLRHGLMLDGVALQPAQVSWQNPEQLRFVLREGKKRQIRRMCEQVGLHVTGLKRVRIGRITLGQLPMGQWRYLSEGEMP